MLVRDYTKRYSPLGKWAGQVAGFGDWMELIQAGITATGATVGAIAGAVAAGAAKPTQPTVQQGTGGALWQPYGPQYANPPAAAGTVSKQWYKDPLVLGAAGLGVVGLLFMLKGGGRRPMGSFAGHGRKRRR